MPVIFRIARLSNLIPCFLGYWFFPHYKLDLRLLVALVTAAILVELTTWVAYEAFDVSNLYILLHIYTIVEFGLLMLIFTIWHKGHRSRNFVAFAGPVMLILLITGKIVEERGSLPSSFDSFATTLEGIVLVSVAVLTLIYLTSEDIIHIFEDPRFWIVCAIMMYFAGNLIVFALGEKVLGVLQTEASSITWTMHSVLNITANTLYAYAFYLRYKQAMVRPR